MVKSFFKVSLLFSWIVFPLLALNTGVFSYKDLRSLCNSFLAEKGGTAWVTAAEGISHRKAPLPRKGGRDGSECLLMVRLDPARFRAGILYAHAMGNTAMTVKDMVARSGAAAGINGSYFDENDRPLGFLKTRGKMVNDYIATPVIYSGIIGFSKGRLSIVHRDTFHPLSYDEAFQVGPRLVAGGKATEGLQKTIDFREEHRRAGCGIDREGKIVLFVTAPSYATIGWDELRTILLGPAERGGITPLDVINLDGGSSTQLYVKAGSFELKEGNSQVPLGIGFFRK
ncbi:MAG: phosphodiester glycosidase family protein [Candidatus Eremiobacteraeota bacterium]|nr:phosphodiester glycosidase family protein [Candidatus Eremiobacteraeota bacterium]